MSAAYLVSVVLGKSYEEFLLFFCVAFSSLNFSFFFLVFKPFVSVFINVCWTASSLFVYLFIFYQVLLSVLLSCPSCNALLPFG